MLIVVGGKPLVHHIELRNAPVLGRVVPVPGDGEPPAVEGGNFLALLTLRGQPGLDGSLQPLLDLPTQIRSLLVLRLGQVHH